MKLSLKVRVLRAGLAQYVVRKFIMKMLQLPY